HYTTHAGLIGIATNRNIWATNIRFLNDLEEVKSFLRQITAAIVARGWRTEDRELSEYFLHSVAGADIYVSSFTESGDLLSQWRGYGGGSRGYSVGFSGFDLATVAKQEHALFGKCIYDHSTRQKIVDELLDDAQNQSTSDRNFYLVSGILKVAPFIKDRHFVEEKEWRLVHGFKPEQVQFRAGHATIVPYGEVVLATCGQPFITTVRIGPSPTPSRAATAVDLLLRKTGSARKVTIENSDPNYQAWSFDIQHTSVPFCDW
ncbi:MAG: DUF2971 domain-containing protein, partial [Acetobacteraceae bacterium]